MSAQAGRKRLQTQCLNVWSSLLRLVSEEAGDPGSGAGRLSRLRPCRIAAVCAVLLLFGLVSGLGRGSDSPAPGRQAARHRKALHDVQTEAIEDPNPQTLHEQQQLQQQQVEQHQKQAPTLPGSNDQAGQGKDARLEKGAAPPAKAPPWRHPRGYMRTRPSRGFYNLSAKDINGEEVSFERYAGKVVLVVNVASACGFTHANYVGLQALYDKYRDYGLEILAFPSNQFGGQEPGTEAEIKEFARSKYSVTFPMFSKVDVNGPDTHPVYQFLKRELPEELGGGSGKEVGKDLVWNFNKFLVDRHGRPTAFYYSSYDAAKLEPDVYRLLQQT